MTEQTKFEVFRSSIPEIKIDDPELFRACRYIKEFIQAMAESRKDKGLRLDELANRVDHYLDGLGIDWKNMSFDEIADLQSMRVKKKEIPLSSGYTIMPPESSGNPGLTFGK